MRRLNQICRDHLAPTSIALVLWLIIAMSRRRWAVRAAEAEPQAVVAVRGQEVVLVPEPGVAGGAGGGSETIK